tara:strand:- start:1169 stop:1342 length:174 start_codon:yes stop_codon:yes gene_type:complete
LLRSKSQQPGPQSYTPTPQPQRASFNARFTPDADNPGYGIFCAAPLAPQPARKKRVA